ncbi:MAG TPA: TlpA disulfide reductase family protein, partial [Acidimicrobiia bacterium]|nr:TlpA disulfide reductase family protein [Acidimicrobiia bacterium]
MARSQRAARTEAIVIGLGLVIAVVVAGAVLAQSRGSAPSDATPAADGSPGTYAIDIDFAYFDGEPGALADFAGQPLVLNFWASWCPPCVAEMPDLEEVHQRFHGEIAFLGMNMQDDLAAAERLVEETGVTYPLAQDPDGAVYRRFGGIAMPTTVLLD